MVSFIILNYNTCELTLRCIRSIEALELPEGREIIVVDNHSRAEERQALLEGLRETTARVVLSRMNTGFGTGNMLGANEARGEFLCFLNSDVCLPEDCVTPLCNYLREHPEAGCITPQQFNGRGEVVPSFNHAPGIVHELVGKKTLEKLCPKRYPKRKRMVYKEPFSATQINGCFMLFPTDVFWAMGGFDINIFLYYEEYDVAMRLAKLGKQCVVLPGARFEHLHEASTSTARSATRRELYLSKMYCYRKHHSWAAAQVYRAINVLKLLFSPKRWYILPVVLRGEALSQSLRHQ